MSRFGDAIDNVTLKPESVVVLGGCEVIFVVRVPANGNSITYHRWQNKEQTSRKYQREGSGSWHRRMGLCDNDNYMTSYPASCGCYSTNHHLSHTAYSKTPPNEFIWWADLEMKTNHYDITSSCECHTVSAHHILYVLKYFFIYTLS